MSKTKPRLSTATDELLRGMPVIKEATGAASDQAIMRLVRQGKVPVTKWGKEWVTTKQAILDRAREQALAEKRTA